MGEGVGEGCVGGGRRWEEREAGKNASQPTRIHAYKCSSHHFTTPHRTPDLMKN